MMQRVTIVNHCALEMDCAPALLWKTLVENYVEGGGFARAGYRIVPLDEPALPLGGYRMRLEDEGREDERICRITERDEQAMRLSVHADYLSPGANAMTVYATYQSEPAGSRARFLLDCHSTLNLETGPDASRENIAQSIAALRDQFDRGIRENAERLGARLEATVS